MNRSSTALPETHVTVEDLIAEGDKVVVRREQKCHQIRTKGNFYGKSR